jgi:hypothetical protein
MSFMMAASSVDDVANLAVGAAGGFGLGNFMGFVAPWAGMEIKNWVSRKHFLANPVTRSTASGWGGLPYRYTGYGKSLMEISAFNRWEAGQVRAGIGAFKSAFKTGGWRGIGGAIETGLSTTGKAALISKAGGLLTAVGNIAWLAPLALDAGRAVGSGLAALGKDRSKLDFGTPFIDTEQAYTQRQAGLMAIHNSQLQTRSFFGREAEYMHR